MKRQLFEGDRMSVSPRKLALAAAVGLVAFAVVLAVVHNARNAGTAPVRLVGVYVVEKGIPLAPPAPAPLQ